MRRASTASASPATASPRRSRKIRAFQRDDGSFDRERLDRTPRQCRHEPRRLRARYPARAVYARRSPTRSARGLKSRSRWWPRSTGCRTRSGRFPSIVVDATSIEAVGAPSQSDLQTYFDENKEKFRAPEYRKLALLTLDPAKIADPAAITDEDVAAEYEKRKASLTQPERRTYRADPLRDGRGGERGDEADRGRRGFCRGRDGERR